MSIEPVIFVFITPDTVLAVVALVLAVIGLFVLRDGARMPRAEVLPTHAGPMVLCHRCGRMAPVPTHQANAGEVAVWLDRFAEQHRACCPGRPEA